MRFIVAVILTALLALALGLFLPWYSVACAAFIVALVVPQKPFVAFLSAFLGVFLLWGVHITFISSQNHHRLATLAGDVILQNPQPFFLILASALIGGVVASFAGLTGNLLRGFLFK